MTDRPGYKVHRARVRVPGPWTKWWEHPWQWWKTRHMRADVLEEERRLGADPLRREVRDALDRALEGAVLGDADLDPR